MDVPRDEFLDIMHPVLCYSCGENVASRADEYDELCLTATPKEALDRMGITNLCTRQQFITGGSNKIIISPCSLCVRGEVCLTHNIWSPTTIALSGINSQQTAQREVTVDGDSSTCTHRERGGGESTRFVRTISEDRDMVVSDELIPPKDRRARPYNSEHIATVAKIPNPPKEFGIPLHLAEYDAVSPWTILESNHRVKVTMGQVYRVTL